MCLDELIAIAIPYCKAAEADCARTGPGRRPEIPDWVMAVLIMAATFKKKKSKNAQFRWIVSHQKYLMAKLNINRLPARSTYYDRFQRTHRIFAAAVRRLGQAAVRYGWADASVVSVDKSLLSARGPKWWKSDRQKKRLPLPGIDQDSQFGFSSHHGWVQGYSFEVVVSCGKNRVVWPLLASADAANLSEHRSFEHKIPHLPPTTRYILADAGYDNGRFAEQIEWSQQRRTGRRFLCPLNSRGFPKELSPRRPNESKAVYGQRQRRAQRHKYFQRPEAKRKYRLRALSVEPFNEWFKSAFEFSQTVWHRGLNNNRTQILAAIFAYQVMLRYNQKRGQSNGKIRPILDAL